MAQRHTTIGIRFRLSILIDDDPFMFPNYTYILLFH